MASSPWRSQRYPRRKNIPWKSYIITSVGPERAEVVELELKLHYGCSTSTNTPHPSIDLTRSVSESRIE
jgi:hypothetical protein